MTKGARAIWLAVGLSATAAVLALALKDGSIFTYVAGAVLLGKFGYDGFRDRRTEQKSTNRAPLSLPAESAEEHGD